MPDKPKKDIDELLREYARSRKEMAGEDIILKTTARRQLLCEVQKVYGKNRNFWETVLLMFRESALLKFGLAVGIFVIAVIVIKSVFVQNQPQTMSMAKSDNTRTQQPSESVTQPEIADRAKSEILSKDGSQPLKTILADKTSEKGAAVKDSAMTYKPLEKLNREDEGKAGLLTKPVETAEKKATDVDKFTLAEKRVTVIEESPQPAAPAALAKLAVTKSAADVEFEKLPSTSETSYQNLLNRFSLKVDGSKIVITDGDGSIYEGELLKPEIYFDSLAREESSPLPSEKPSGQQALSEISEFGAIAKTATANDLIFCVKGTNQNTKLALTFYGKVSSGVVGAVEQSESVKPGRFLNAQRRIAPGGASLGAAAPVGARGSAEYRRDRPATMGMGREFTDNIAKPTNQTNVLIEGALFIEGKTNLILRAIRNEDGYYIRN
jgi:hypothetical protein